MSPSSVTVNILFHFTVLFLAPGVYPKTASDDSDQPNRFRACDAWSYCTPIKKCSSFRDGWKRRGVGITCGHGSGPYRMVCCPRTSREVVPARQTNSLIEKNPAPLTDSKSNGAQQANRLKANSSAPLTDSKSNGGCGISQGVDWFKEHMANGEDELEATWPWMVAIKIRHYYTGIPRHCSSGVLIDKKHVLTIANCYSPPRWARHELPVTVHAGSDDYELGKVYPVSKIKIHEDFNHHLPYNNIAILTLEREVDIPNFVPICLPDKRLEGKDLTGWGTTFVGWGKEKNSEPQSSVLMQMDDIPIVSNRECNQLYNEYNETVFSMKFPGGIPREIMCAGKTEGSRDICKGTGGSPLMILDRKRWFVVGLSSFGYRCGHSLPSGHTNVLYYVDWIKHNIKD